MCLTLPTCKSVGDQGVASQVTAFRPEGIALAYRLVDELDEQMLNDAAALLHTFAAVAEPGQRLPSFRRSSLRSSRCLRPTSPLPFEPITLASGGLRSSSFFPNKPIRGSSPTR